MSIRQIVLGYFGAWGAGKSARMQVLIGDINPTAEACMAALRNQFMPREPRVGAGRQLIESMMELGYHRICDEPTFQTLKASGLLGTNWVHYKTRKTNVYTIVGFIWDTEIDRWVIEYERDDSPLRFTRSMVSWLEWAEPAVRRFTQV